MSRISHTFQQLNQQTALIPYITAGDPNLNTTLELMHTMAENGADIIELGIPFSDPMADGAAIQRATERALTQGISLQNVLDTVVQFRKNNHTTPIVLMGYLNPIHHMGYTEFATAAAHAGVDGVLTVDCPIEHITPLYHALQNKNLDCIFLIAPTTDEQRIKQIAKYASGFVYYVSLKGVTGASQLNTTQVANKLKILRQYIHIPIGVGFGINDTSSAQQIGQVADAVIIGSRIIREIESSPTHEAENIGHLIAELKTAILKT